MIRLATVFSGVGAIEQALLKRNIEYEIVFACDSGERTIKENPEEIKKEIENLSNPDKRKYVEEIYNNTKKNNYVKKSYCSNYQIEDDNWNEDIRFLDGTKYHQKVDLFVGGSPCQSFSIIGKRQGLEDARGTLFFDFARLINEIQPKVFLFENVVGLLTHDKGETWNIIQGVFASLGYNVFTKVLNSLDFGIPQDRKRIFVVGFKDPNIKFNFPDPVGCEMNVRDYLEESRNVNPRHYFGKKGFEFVTNPKYKNRARVDKLIIQTQKANQQYNWNGDFVFVPLEEIKDCKEILSRAYIGNYNGKVGAIRQLTYRECFRLMGFSDDFVIDVPNVQAYRQAGNSIVVNVLEHIITSILKVQKFEDE